MKMWVDIFFFNDTATTEIYTLSLHDALPISCRSTPPGCGTNCPGSSGRGSGPHSATARSGPSCRAEPMPLVAILGNGPVGQTTALMLARWGVPVVLLDQRPHRDAVGSKSIVQQRDVLDAWAAVGAGRRIADEGLTWTTARTFYRDAELFSVTF